MAVKFHRCGNLWVKGSHPCWRVQQALDEMGVDYEIVKEPTWRGSRKAVLEHTHQKKLPCIELEDGTWYREESSDMILRIRKGELVMAAHEPVPESEWQEKPPQTAEEQDELDAQIRAESQHVSEERGSQQWQG